MTATAVANRNEYLDDTPLTGPDEPFLGRFDLIATAPVSGPGKAFFVRDRFPPVSIKNDHPAVIRFIEADPADPIPRLLFKATARAASQLDHPNIIRTYETGEVDALLYSLSEWPRQCESLSALIARTGWLNIQRGQGQKILSQVIAALAYAHKQNILHLSLTSEAVLLEQGGGVVIDGFGLVASEAKGAVIGSLTRGLKPDYVSPEQLSGGPVTANSDLYSLGIVIYEMLTDRVPAIRPDGSRRWGAYPALPPNLLVPELPEAISNTVLTLLADDPDDRFISFDELRLLIDSSDASSLGTHLIESLPAELSERAPSIIDVGLGDSFVMGSSEAVPETTNVDSIPAEILPVRKQDQTEAQNELTGHSDDILGLGDLVSDAIPPVAWSTPDAPFEPASMVYESVVPDSLVPYSLLPEPLVPGPAEHAPLKPGLMAQEAAAPGVEYIATAPEVIAYEDATPEVIAHDATAPEVIAHDAAAPEVIAHDAAAPAVIAHDAAAPEVIAYEAAAPEVIAHEAPAPEVIAYDAAAPAAAASEAVAPAGRETYEPPIISELNTPDRLLARSGSQQNKELVSFPADFAAPRIEPPLSDSSEIDQSASIMSSPEFNTVADKSNLRRNVALILAASFFFVAMVYAGFVTGRRPKGEQAAGAAGPAPAPSTANSPSAISAPSAQVLSPEQQSNPTAGPTGSTAAAPPAAAVAPSLGQIKPRHSKGTRHWHGWQQETHWYSRAWSPKSARSGRRRSWADRPLYPYQGGPQSRW